MRYPLNMTRTQIVAIGNGLYARVGVGKRKRRVQLENSYLASVLAHAGSRGEWSPRVALRESVKMAAKVAG